MFPGSLLALAAGLLLLPPLLRLGAVIAYGGRRPDERRGVGQALHVGHELCRVVVRSTEDGHIRLCVLAIALYQYDDLSQFNEVVRDLSKLMLDADEFEHIMNEYSWNENAWRTPEETHFWLEKPDTQADIRRWWFLTLPFDKAIHSQLLAAIGTKAKKR